MAQPSEALFNNKISLKVYFFDPFLDPDAERVVQVEFVGGLMFPATCGCSNALTGGSDLVLLLLDEGGGLGLTSPKSVSSKYHRFAELETTMIYDVNSPLFRSFLSQKGGSSDKRKTEEQRPKEQRPKANENKPVMNE
ncbi:hypothetical protein L2E82_20272 [Cichorium intybus]|uniref:Uncharacterized protein n=1 Tax=Cichorium intybus TaxID=13427 RepID=A0ACB9DT69_CICIN|nr:hypothetical protein L2E82_20272 [Cichorium intybus]